MTPQTELKNVIIKKLENAHVIWFQQSKSFILLEEPAFCVFEMISEGKGKDEIINLCKEKYGHLEENIGQFVKEITDNISHCRNPKNTIEVLEKPGQTEFLDTSAFFSRVMYKAGNKFITVYYQNEFLKYTIHPLLKHLEIQSGLPDENVIKLLERNGEFNFIYRDKLSEIFPEGNMEYFTGTVKQQMYSILYNREFNDWMMTMHASGVIQNGNAILFSAAGGSGKSTISALLKAHNYGFICDDFIAADDYGNVYPFPAAISVKDGAVKVLSEFYPELKDKNSVQAVTGKFVQYLPVQNFEEIDAAPFPVKALVFVNYNKSASFVFEEVGKKEALQLLLKETWVNPLPEKVSGFFDWLENSDFYRLQYSKTHQAINAVQTLFESNK